MFRITLLGTSGSIPTVNRGMPSLAIKYESELLLWDCGEGTQRQLMKYKVGYGSIDAIFITHPHLDHYLGLFGLLETLRLSSPSPRPLKLFVPKDLVSGFDDSVKYPFVSVSNSKSGQLYRGHGFTISAFQVKHCRSSYGFIFQENEKIKFNEEKAHGLGLKGKLFKDIQKKGKVKVPNGHEVCLEDVTWVKSGKKVVYTGDCAPDDGIIDAAKNADLLIHEGTFDASKKAEALERAHSTVSDAATIAKRANVKQLVITHISPRYNDISMLVEEARSVFENTIIAEDGIIIDL